MLLITASPAGLIWEMWVKVCKLIKSFESTADLVEMTYNKRAEQCQRVLFRQSLGHVDNRQRSKASQRNSVKLKSEWAETHRMLAEFLWRQLGEADSPLQDLNG